MQKRFEALFPVLRNERTNRRFLRGAFERCKIFYARSVLWLILGT